MLAAHERRAMTGPHGYLHDLRIGRERNGTFDLSARDQYAGPRQDVVDLGDLRVRDADDRVSGGRLSRTLRQDTDADVEILPDVVAIHLELMRSIIRQDAAAKAAVST